ncbi:hypothetical protein Bca52824_032848 [Brassica carinata]|uniref:DUF287 domain-containing protein n=1 Tax=Brassica carinata TaxID=52824 RepID=A0A8X7SDV7_BRACI|nr:hypothetical protein Bca52824_032848 [Brassica carinata]
MLNRDDPKSKEDVSSSVGGDDTSMVILSGDEANPSRIDKYVAPGTDESPRDADESEENAKEEKEPKEVEEEKEPQRNDETALIVRPHGTESHAQSDVSSFLEKSDGVAPTSWVFTSFPIPLEAIPSLRNHFRENVIGARPHCPRMCKMEYKQKSGTKEFSLNTMNDKLGTDIKDIESILVAKTAEKELLETIGVDKESCWADDSNDAAVDSWSKILQKGSTQVFFEERFRIDCEARTAKLNGPTNPIGGPSNNAQSEVHADSVEDTGLEALKAMYGRLMKAVKDAVKDAVKELNKTVFSLSDKITLLEDEVKSLRSSGDNPSEENKESDEEDDVDKASEEEDGGDKETKESEEEDDVNNYIRDVTNEVQKEHGDAKGLGKARSPVYTRSMGFGEEAAGKRNRDAKKAAEKKAAAKKEAAKKAAAEKEAAAAKKAAAEKKAAQKKPPLKPKKNKTKKVGKKTE